GIGYFTWESFTLQNYADIVVGMVTLTGLGLKLGTGLVDLAGGNLILTMVFAMISSLVLGMGVPTTANYVITSTIVAPALVQLGVPLIAAHLFVFYFGIIADITPPVCSAVFAGSAIAGSDTMKTGIIATRIAIGAFIIPYMFVLSPELLLIDVTFFGLCHIIPTALLGMFMLSASTNGWMRC
ncbi:MAG: TRAP transporter large permease subunit, partial [Oscillospiraceae bacterium]